MPQSRRGRLPPPLVDSTWTCSLLTSAFQLPPSLGPPYRPLQDASPRAVPLSLTEPVDPTRRRDEDFGRRGPVTESLLSRPPGPGPRSSSRLLSTFLRRQSEVE